jgi:hypothetical protein
MEYVSVRNDQTNQLNRLLIIDGDNKNSRQPNGHKVRTWFTVYWMTFERSTKDSDEPL